MRRVHRRVEDAHAWFLVSALIHCAFFALAVFFAVLIFVVTPSDTASVRTRSSVPRRRAAAASIRATWVSEPITVDVGDIRCHWS